MAKGIKVVKAVRQKGASGLAWASLVIATVGGTLTTETWIGRVLQWLLEIWPWNWIPAVLLAAAVVALGLDLFLDGVPNQVAIAAALTIPSIAAATSGRLGDAVSRWCAALLDYLDDGLRDWVGTDSATGLAIACIVGSLLMARRVVKKSKSTVAV